MTDRKWDSISVYFDDNTTVQVSRSDFDKLKEISSVLEALIRVKQMQRDVNRLLGEADG